MEQLINADIKELEHILWSLDADIAPTKLQLMSVERMGETIWAKYKV